MSADSTAVESGPGRRNNNFLTAAARYLVGALAAFFGELGGLMFFTLEFLRSLISPPYRFGLWVEQMEFVGVGSTFIICVTGASIGMVLVLEGLWAFQTVHLEVMVGSTVMLFLAREMAPVFGGIIVAARVGAAMTTELGSMRVTEQIDALESMAVRPMNYLVVPRVIATTTMMPVMALVFTASGFFAAYINFVYIQGYDDSVFWANISHYLEVIDITHGLWKALWFGLSVGLIATYFGFNARGGAAGVGIATTRAVVYACVTILFLDYVVTAVGVQL